jgi:hypothetical protein
MNERVCRSFPSAAFDVWCSAGSDGVTDFTKIVLSTWAFSVEAAEVFASAIARLPQLSSAILSDMIAGRPEAEGLRVYEVLAAALKDKHLTEIDLSDNAVGPKGVQACRELLTSQEHLEKLYFCNCGISAEAAVSISELLLYRVPTRYVSSVTGCLCGCSVWRQYGSWRRGVCMTRIGCGVAGRVCAYVDGVCVVAAGFVCYTSSTT